ncbi:DNA topoisomerase IB [Agrobacterium rosae]|uniref:DNA topoisomerase n=1 Tax=Agrobacterium rosae TaxID=1972867 RepID=A0AAE5RYW4_9HYPH|nr:DNA topoisomerase IB [Agrobacterium rosae]KAA3511504.1 DNA topoisomerase IB [Agrobacterium rosae]KAA3519073.1 DNA topoisomerase IB [Agrobacterium rosae]MBN7806881.1 DNA topoisomerase IB [Agrobacterium rosae]MCM2435298.1 DNA topoisomerase IB [Agrobacterium rosae]MDX8330968.1 DNA topoisomerase IB [Agrobacterium rosae]
MNQLPIRILRKVGLTYVSDQEPGISREKRGKGFAYRLPDGALLSDKLEITRLKSLGVPPAYERVWICIDPSGHLQATGYDARGRKQYRYHPDWHALRGENKFYQLKTFGEALPAIRRRATSDLSKQVHSADVTLAALVLLLDAAYLRVGNKTYLETNGTYGATTLLKKHVSFGETIELRFAAKGGQRVKRKLKHPRLQRILENIADLPGRQLFVWQDENGLVHPVDSSALNAYISQSAGEGISAKTFRTWGGTLAAFGHAARALGSEERPTIKGMCMAAAEELSNTPAICRKSYVHPAVLELATEDKSVKRLQKILGSDLKPIAGLRADERRLLEFLP